MFVSSVSFELQYYNRQCIGAIQGKQASVHLVKKRLTIKLLYDSYTSKFNSVFPLRLKLNITVYISIFITAGLTKFYCSLGQFMHHG